MVTYRNQIFMEISSQIMGCSADFGSMQGSQTVFLSQEVLTAKSTSSPGHNHRHPLTLGKETGGDPARKAFPKELSRHSSPSYCSLQHLFLNFTNPWLCFSHLGLGSCLYEPGFPAIKKPDAVVGTSWEHSY